MSDTDAPAGGASAVGDRSTWLRGRRGRPPADVRRTGAFGGHGRWVWALSAVVAAVYAAMSLLRHHALRSTAYDLGIFHQAVEDWSRFRLPVSPIKGVHDQFGADFGLLGDHFHPILAVLSPAYWIWPRPETLLVCQALIIGASVPAVWLFTRRALGAVLPAYLVATAYSLYWGLQVGVSFDFHELAFAVPLLAWAIERWQAGRWRTAVVLVLSLLLVKENLAFVVVAFGLMALLGRRWRIGAGLVLGGAAAYLVITRVLMPAAGGIDFAYWNYDHLGDDLPSALAYLVTHPADAVRLLVDPWPKLRLWWMTFLPFGLLSFVSPYVVPALPLMAERVYSGLPKHWAVGYHYTMVLAPIVALAAVDGLARVRRWATGVAPPPPHGWSTGEASAPAAAVAHPRRDRWLVVGLPAALVVLALVLTVQRPFPLASLWSPEHWNTADRVAAGHAAVDLVPDGARVEATDRLVPQLVHRTDVLMTDGQLHDVDWLVVDVMQRDWPFVNIAGQQQHVDRRLADGWEKVYDAGGFVVLRRGD